MLSRFFIAKDTIGLREISSIAVTQGYFDLWLGEKLFLFRIEGIHAHHGVF